MPRLQEDDAQLGTDEGEDEPRRPVAGPHVDQPARKRVRGGGKDVFHEQGHPLVGRARTGEVHPRAPGGEQVEIALEAGAGRLRQRQRVEGRPVQARG